MSKKIQQSFIMPDHLGGMRLDQALSKFLTEYSRTQIQDWIKKNEITVNDKVARARDIVLGGEKIDVLATMKSYPEWKAEAITLDIVYEDDSLLVINKPAGMVVHPGAGNTSQTLLNALLHHVPALQALPRAGIVHRIDKNTSGLLVIAKTDIALKKLSDQLKKHTISRIYQAVVTGVLTGGGTIDQPIGRHPIQRKRMAVIETGKPAITHYRIVEKYRAYTRVKVQLETGRTHQIRVHFSYKHHALLGDQTYGGRLQLPKGASPELIQTLRTFKRQALHASELELIHPETGQEVRFHAPLPNDMIELINTLKLDLSTIK
jgi:23S rRNA pseudouridine1911/1915/1917 synthase